MFKCNECVKSYVNHSSLHRHLKEVHGLNKIRYNCVICNKSFGRQATLRFHERYHARIDVCSCGVACTGRRSLITHQKQCEVFLMNLQIEEDPHYRDQRMNIPDNEKDEEIPTDDIDIPDNEEDEEIPTDDIDIPDEEEDEEIPTDNQQQHIVRPDEEKLHYMDNDISNRVYKKHHLELMKATTIQEREQFAQKCIDGLQHIEKKVIFETDLVNNAKILDILVNLKFKGCSLETKSFCPYCEQGVYISHYVEKHPAICNQGCFICDAKFKNNDMREFYDHVVVKHWEMFKSMKNT